jgi:glycosyltransferase involved in cell wall biosynthesis
VFADLPRETDQVTKLGLIPGRYVLTVGRLVPEKRQLDLLLAFREARLDGWKLAIVGKIDHESKYADMLSAEARLDDNVVMAGFQSGESLRQLYAHAGLFVLPSSHEGLAIVLLEALSYGLPVLVSNIPPNTEVVSDPSHLFCVNDTHDLSSKLAALTSAKPDASEREAIRQESARRYDWTDIALKTSATYRDLVEPKRTRARTRTNGTRRRAA